MKAFIKGIIITRDLRGANNDYLERSCHEKVGDPDGPDKPEGMSTLHMIQCHAAPT